jgi:hypothetical protein
MLPNPSLQGALATKQPRKLGSPRFFHSLAMTGTLNRRLHFPHFDLRSK